MSLCQQPLLSSVIELDLCKSAKAVSSLVNQSDHLIFLQVKTLFYPRSFKVSAGHIRFYPLNTLIVQATRSQVFFTGLAYIY